MIGTVVIPIVVIVTLVIINGVFVAAEFALVGARRSRLQTRADNGSRGARWLLGVFDRPTGKDGYIAIAQLGITLASIGLGMYGEPAVAHWLYEPFERFGLSESAAHTVGFIVALSIITYLHVVLGEMIPKALALQSPESVSVGVSGIMRIFGTLFRPMVAVLNAAALGLMRLLRIPEPDQSLTLHTSAELAIVTDEAAHSGQIGAMQRDLIRNVFDLEERTAADLMISRSHIDALDLSTSHDELGALIAASDRSRYPVVDGSLDQVVGVFHIKDFIRAADRGAAPALPELIRPIPAIGATVHADEILQRFRRDRTHIALVVDEHGATLGLVTMDDIISTVMDEEVHAPNHIAIEHDDGSLSFDGETTLAELVDHHDIAFSNPDVTTIAGVVLASTPTLPTVGISVRVQGRELTVEDMRGRKITRVRLRTPAVRDDGDAPNRSTDAGSTSV